MRPLIDRLSWGNRGVVPGRAPSAPVLTWQGNHTLSLSAPSATCRRLVIERSADGSSGWTQIASVGPLTVLFADPLPGATNYYRAREFNAYGTSPYSNVVNDLPYPAGYNPALVVGGIANALFQINPAAGAYSDTSLTTPAVDGGNVLGIKDLTGNGCHFVDGGGGAKPQYVASGYSGRPAIRFPSGSWLDLVTAAQAQLGNLGAGGRSHTIVLAYVPPSDGSYHCVLAGPSSTDILNAAPGATTRFAGGGGYDGTFLAEGVQLWVSTYDVGLARETAWHNGQQVYQVTGQLPAATANDPWRLGLRMSYNFGLGGDLLYAGVFLGALDPSDSGTVAALHQALAAETMAANQWHLAFTGNSLVERGWMHALRDALNTLIGTTNLGWSGRTWAGMQAHAAGREIRLSNMLPCKMLTLAYEWANSYTSSYTDQISAADAYLNTLTAAGFGGANRPVMLIGPLSCVLDPDGSQNRAIRTAMLARCDAAVGSVPRLYPAKAGETRFKWYFDATADPVIGAMNDATSPNYANSTYFNPSPDEVHLTFGAGETYAGTMIAPAVTHAMAH